MNDSALEPAFVDTNILVYSASFGDARSATAQSLVRELILQGGTAYQHTGATGILRCGDAQDQSAADRRASA